MSEGSEDRKQTEKVEQKSLKADSSHPTSEVTVEKNQKPPVDTKQSHQTSTIKLNEGGSLKRPANNDLEVPAPNDAMCGQALFANRKKKAIQLSFADDFSEEVEQQVREKMVKNPASRKSGKADAIESRERQLREEFQKKWRELSEQLIEFEFSYWDGASVVKKLRRKKSEKFRDIIEVCRLALIENFQNLAACSASQLLLVIKDFVTPLDMSFVQIELDEMKTLKKDLLLNLQNIPIKTKSKELTLSVNKDGPFRIIERARYEKNKSMHPFCFWHTRDMDEQYDL